MVARRPGLFDENVGRLMSRNIVRKPDFQGADLDAPARVA
jgi:hypothetical protein